MEQHLIRRVRAEEWPAARDLRLDALLDPLAGVAFLDTYENASARPDAFWQQRTQGAAAGTAVAQFVAERRDSGGWDGMVSVLVEEADSADIFGRVVEQRQAHLVGVFVREEQRGSGLTHALFEAAVGWARQSADVERIRLFVHEDNSRAAGFYRKFGFEPSGLVVPEAGGSGADELEFVLKV